MENFEFEDKKAQEDAALFDPNFSVFNQDKDGFFDKKYEAGAEDLEFFEKKNCRNIKSEKKLILFSHL